MPTYPKRLIEVDLPIKRISAHARREKSIRHGHISTLHIWWARRPLAACRAVICAALWLDPVDELCPQRFREDATAIINKFAQKAAIDLAKTCATETWQQWQVLAKPENQLDANNPQHLNSLRDRLLDFIADFANWDNSTQPDYLETSRALTQAAHEALGGIEGTKPLVVDPFAGGGAIPLEALRVGADAFASDLNPVAVLLNKVVLEYIPKYGQQLADEVRKWGQWVKEEAEKELAKFYPKDPDGATPIAYLWARTITCEGPGCGAEVPLMRSLWLAKKKNRSIALQIIPKPEEKRIDFTIIQKAKAKDVGDGTVKRGSTTCPCCGFTTPVASVRKQLKVRNGGADDARLFCVVTTREKEKGRFYRLPTEKDLEAVGKAREELETRKQKHQGELSLVPDEPLPPQGALGFRVQLYGMEQWGDLFTSRQSLALTTLVRLVNDVGEKLADGEDEGLAIAVQTVLSIGVSKITDVMCSLVTWQTSMDRIGHLFTRQAISMAWDFAETSPVSNAAGDYSVTIKNVLEVLDRESTIAYPVATIEKSSATTHPLPDNFAQGFFSDPPYCLLPGTLILTDKGYKPIETIQIGEKVLSHQGRFVPVLRLYQRPYQGYIQKLNITGVNSPLYITPEHPVYGIHTADCPYEFKYCRPTCSYLAQQGRCKHQKFETYQATWIPARDIQPYDLIGFPTLQTTLKPQDLKLSEILTPDNYTLDGNQLFYEKINPKTLAVRQKLQTLEPKRGALMELARELKVRPNLVYRLNQELKASKSPLHLQTNIIKVDNHLLKLLGYFVADGYANLRNDGGTVNFTFALQQDYFGQEVTTLMERVFGLKPGKSTNNKYAKNRSIRYNFYSKPVAELFRNLCYADDGYKIVPSWVLYLPKNLLWSFIEGLWNGDGYRSSQKYSLTNVSPYLIGQTQIILNKLGIITKLYRETKSRSNIVNGKTVKGNGRFSLDILGTSLLELANNIGIPKTENIERQFTSQQGFFKNGFIWRPIRQVETIPYTGMVYNLETSDHSYTTAAGCVHNCDAVPYADLSDFFYVWLKRTLANPYPSLFTNLLTPKLEECIVDEVKGKDQAYFEKTMTDALAEGQRILAPDGVGMIVFAHKATSSWEAQLQAMTDAGWTITASWAIDTEMGTRLRAMNSAALASSVHLVCRPRNTTEIGDWRDVLQELPQRIHDWMPRLASEGVVGADAIFACLGPALEIFSRYSSVEKASGEEVTLKDYLEYVWAAVSKEALSMIFTDADATGFEEDARLTAMWLWTLSTGTSDSSESEPDDEETSSQSTKSSGYILEFDAARKIAQGLGAHLENLTTLVQIKGSKAQLLPVSERAEYLLPSPGRRRAGGEVKAPTKRKKKGNQQLAIPGLLNPTESPEASTDWGETAVENLGNTVLDRIHQSMILFAAGRSEALKRFLVDDGVGAEVRFWKLAQALSALYPNGTDEKRWVDGVLARKKGLGF